MQSSTTPDPGYQWESSFVLHTVIVHRTEKKNYMFCSRRISNSFNKDLPMKWPDKSFKEKYIFP